MKTPETSLAKRYTAKLSTNLVGLAINLVIQAIIPRGLGPRIYGDFSFLSNFFTQFTAFWDAGTSICFYTKLSKKPGEFGVVPFYIGYALLVSLLMFACVGLAQLTSIHQIIWPNQQLVFIYLAAAWGGLTWLVTILHKMVDAYGLTVSGEKCRIVQRFLGLTIIVALFMAEYLNLYTFFLYHYVIMFFLIGLFLWVFEKGGQSFRRDWKLSGSKIKQYARAFYDYSHPLYIFAFVSLIVGIGDRWLLQFFGGSIEQGLFGLSYNIGTICFLFGSAMTPLIMREFAIAHGQNDTKEMARLFRRHVPALYAVAAYFACFVAVQADNVTLIFGGDQFRDASLAVTIMAFYPISQTYGQISSSVFFATGQTKLYSKIGIFFLVIGLPVAFIFIAPSEYWGLNGGAVGLALKTVLIQFVSVNVRLYYITRILGLRFRNYLFHQLGCISIMILVGLGASGAIEYLMKPFAINTISTFIVSGLLYSLLVIVTAFIFPGLFGADRSDLNKIMHALHIRLR